MRFLDAWRQLHGGDVLGFVLPVAFMGLLVFLPGRILARIAAAGVALGILVLPGMVEPLPLRLGWVALWGGIAWGVRSAPARGRSGRRIGLLETGGVGLTLAIALLAVLMVAIGRADLDEAVARAASYGVFVLCLGLLHLMLRRHIVRLAIGLAMMGFGLQLLSGVAQVASAPAGAPDTYAILLATVLACALAVRIGRTRERVAGSAWVGDAHDLHD